MDRVAETTLTSIGIVLHILYMLMILLIKAVLPLFLSSILIFLLPFYLLLYNNRDGFNDGVEHIANSLLVMGMIITILSLIAVFIIAKKPKFASAILFFTTLIALFNMNWISGLLWLISAIMLLSRKPKDIKKRQYALQQEKQQTIDRLQ